MAWRKLRGRVANDELNAIGVEENWVEPATPRINVSTDGEVSLMAAPLHYRIRPGGLAVVVPHPKRS
jgi:diacylglycerol kinase family enzyme